MQKFSLNLYHQFGLAVCRAPDSRQLGAYDSLAMRELFQQHKAIDFIATRLHSAASLFPKEKECEK